MSGKTGLISEGSLVLYALSPGSQDSLNSALIHEGNFRLTGESNLSLPRICMLAFRDDKDNSGFNILLLLENHPVFIEQRAQEERVIYKGSAMQDSLTRLFEKVRQVEEQVETADEIMPGGEDETKLKQANVQLKKIIWQCRQSPGFAEMSFYITAYFRYLFEEDLSFIDSLCRSVPENESGQGWAKQVCKPADVLTVKNPFHSTFIGMQNKNGKNIKGFVMDKTTGETVPFSNIIIQDHKAGTMANEKGYFFLPVDEKWGNDTIVFSSVGYEPLRMTVHDAINNKAGKYYLRQVTIQLSSVEIHAHGSKTVTLGEGRRAIGGGGITYYSDTGAGTQVAHLIETNGYDSVCVQSARLHIFSNGCGRFPLRTRFYEQDSLTGGPGREVIFGNGIFYINFQKGWAEADLARYNIIFKKNFFVAFEWLAKEGCSSDKRPFFSARSAVKNSVTYYKYFMEDGWKKAPQNYVINVKVEAFK